MFAGITDRPATEACYKGGVGARIPLSIGATLDPKASQSVKTEVVVKFLLAETDPARREAVVEIQGITLVVAAYRRPYHDIQDFKRFGLDPKSFKIIVVKSGYLSPELAPIANPSLWRSRMALLTRTSSTCPRTDTAGRVTRSSRT